jgi:hypothetical protein
MQKHRFQNFFTILYYSSALDVHLQQFKVYCFKDSYVTDTILYKAIRNSLHVPFNIHHIDIQ